MSDQMLHLDSNCSVSIKFDQNEKQKHVIRIVLLYTIYLFILDFPTRNVKKSKRLSFMPCSAHRIQTLN